MFTGPPERGSPEMSESINLASSLHTLLGRILYVSQAILPDADRQARLAISLTISTISRQADQSKHHHGVWVAGQDRAIR